MNNDSVYNTFDPAPGYILLERIEDTSTFKTADKPEDITSQWGKVIRTGSSYKNEFGTVREAPPVKEGDFVLYRHEYNQDEFEFEFIKYPVVKFDQVRGVINAAKD
jgi:co-chaperonin GroES (HSP10)